MTEGEPLFETRSEVVVNTAAVDRSLELYPGRNELRDRVVTNRIEFESMSMGELLNGPRESVRGNTPEGNTVECKGARINWSEAELYSTHMDSTLLILRFADLPDLREGEPAVMKREQVEMLVLLARKGDKVSRLIIDSGVTGITTERAKWALDAYTKRCFRLGLATLRSEDTDLTETMNKLKETGKLDPVQLAQWEDKIVERGARLIEESVREEE